MKLYITPTSPYSRRARIAIHEAGQMDNTEEITMRPQPENYPTLTKRSPAGKVPTLELDDGTTLTECMIIARYMDDLSGGKLYPKDLKERAIAYEIEAMGAVMMDSTFVRSSQNRLDPSEQSKSIIEKEIKRSARCYDALEGIVDRLEGRTDMAALTVASALSYADWRAADDNWRDSHPKLDAWMKTIESRPSFAATARPNDA